MKRISLANLLENHKSLSYTEQYSYIRNCIERDKIRPVKSSPLNGKSPALHETYWIVEKKKDYSELKDELMYRLPAAIATDYYMKHLDVYEKERKWVLLLGSYLEKKNACSKSTSQNISNEISLNERSFQIWGQEKFLQRGQGKTVLKHCNVTVEQLDIYETSEPLSYYSASRRVPQTILIIENKDTFYSMRRFLIQNPEQYIFGQPIQTLIYGAGKGILRSIEDFRFCVEPYMNHEDNRYLYFGDLDYEGIGIYERLAKMFDSEHEMYPFLEAYDAMFKKAEIFEQQKIQLPDTKEGQNRNLSGRFFSYFGEKEVEQMREILEREKYIPQEIINITDLTLLGL